jgi:glycosyltransferase involved in cell wall biosynthesis
MNLLIIQPTGDKFGHFGITTTMLSYELASLGHNVTVVTNKLEISKFISPGKLNFKVIEVDNGKYCIEKFEREIAIHPLKYWFRYFLNSFVILKAALNLNKLEKFHGIYLTDCEFGVASFLLKLNSSKLPPIIMQINASNFSFKDYPGNFFKRLYKSIQKEILRLAIGREISAFSIFGSWHSSRLRKQLRIKSENFPIRIIPDAVTYISKPLTLTEARSKLGIKYTGNIFLFLGLLRQDKGLEDLAQAINILKNEKKDFAVIIAGFPFDYKESEIIKLFQIDQPDNRIIHHFLSYVSDEEISNYYFAADCLLLPYNEKYKGSTGPLTKGACTYSIPVIVSDISEMGRITSDYNFGFVFKPGDPLELAGQMSKFLSLPSDEKNILKYNTIKFGKDNSWSAMAKRYENLFLELQGGIKY